MGEMLIETPGTWASSSEGRSGVDIEWVDRFKDRRLSALVEEALENNQDLKAASARVQKAWGNARVVGASALPSIDANFDPARSKQNFLGFPFGGGGVPTNQFTTFSASLDIRWELDVWGRIRAGQSAATAQMEAAQLDERAARASIAAQVAKTWFLIGEATEQLALARETLATYEENAEAVRDRFKRGQEENGAASSLRLAETDAATARATVKERQQQLETATRQLEILLGRYPKNALSRPGSMSRLPTSPPVGLPSELLQRRPDVLAAERRFASAGRSYVEAKRALFPRLALTGSAGRSTLELEDLLDSDFGVWRLAGNVVQPILAGGQIRAQAAIRKSDEREALANLQQTVLQAFFEVEDALGADRLLASRESAIREAARLAEEAHDSARADYRDGLGDILTVLGAQTRELQTRSQLLTLRRLRLENRVNLHLALGGDFSPQPRS
jgi:NodT family efflux transporter outer membrane factor (OMF) lipoprotein